MEFFRSFIDTWNTWILHSKKEYRLTFYDDRYDHTKCLSKTWKDNVKEVTIQSIERKIQIQKKLKRKYYDAYSLLNFIRFNLIVRQRNHKRSLYFLRLMQSNQMIVKQISSKIMFHWLHKWQTA